jgi:hypothetical protein
MKSSAAVSYPENYFSQSPAMTQGAFKQESAPRAISAGFELGNLFHTHSA